MPRRPFPCSFLTVLPHLPLGRAQGKPGLIKTKNKSRGGKKPSAVSTLGSPTADQTPVQAATWPEAGLASRLPLAALKTPEQESWSSGGLTGHPLALATCWDPCLPTESAVLPGAGIWCLLIPVAGLPESY